MTTRLDGVQEKYIPLSVARHPEISTEKKLDNTIMLTYMPKEEQEKCSM
jgi:hypothetical protein